MSRFFEFSYLRNSKQTWIVVSPTSGLMELFQVQIQKWAFLVISENLGHKLFDLSENLKPWGWREYMDCNVMLDLLRL